MPELVGARAESLLIRQVGSGPRYQILSLVFARCASQKTHRHARIARETREGTITTQAQ